MKFKIKNIFLVNLLYGLSPAGLFLQYILSITYIFLLAYLLKPETALCMPSNLTTQEYNDMTENVDQMMSLHETQFLSFIASINRLVPIESKIDLAQMGVLTIKKGYSAIPTLFPLNRMSDYSLVIPYKTNDLDPISAIFVGAIREPNYVNVQMAGTFINKLYLENLEDLTNSESSKELKIEAWNRMIELVPPALELQISTFNHFLEMINYPYKVEDFYEGSAYHRADMFEHAGMMSAYDPYGHIIPEQEITEIYILENLQEKEISFIAPSLLKDPWNTVEPPPIHPHPFAMTQDQITEKQQILSQTREQFDLEKKRLILEKKMEILQDKMAHARQNQMLIKAGIVFCSSAIFGVTVGIGIIAYRAKYGGI